MDIKGFCRIDKTVSTGLLVEGHTLSPPSDLFASGLTIATGLLPPCIGLNMGWILFSILYSASCFTDFIKVLPTYQYLFNDIRFYLFISAT